MQPINKTSRWGCLGAGLLALLLAGGAVADTPMGQERGERYRDSGEQRYRDRGSWDRGDRDPSWRRPRDARRVERDRDERPLGQADDRYRSRRGARDAADAVRRGERGRGLSSEPVDDRGYRVRVLTPDGYVRERYVDPYDNRRGRSERRRRD
ncbi:hypothetical protein [Immundisolibacter sp.]|uniref:hypothetical protein n=1 Tax=Immundisolibacter sp. TaxID=1934948 RepID=UPI00356285E6